MGSWGIKRIIGLNERSLSISLSQLFQQTMVVIRYVHGDLRNQGYALFLWN